ncbi:minichromosome maintenance component complex 7-like protein (nucleomorph) [Cryptomonas paramecium]|uniref:Minichromosome maintenance component complex 7-like protein n=1 Tax=Cryptomonas paramaecium TaxID=2898 RepID=F2HHV9_9CRYP|nr:minichromosome maintenance component complex 7-like protein [Cryptomonas paramecium]AEA38905.1 minichromosome maintenance component complex 7-like protein [Cryptomonas paramecium]
MSSLENCKTLIDFLIRNLYISTKRIDKDDNLNYVRNYKYMFQLYLILSKKKKFFVFFLDDLLIFFPTTFLRLIMINVKKFIEVLKTTVDFVFAEIKRFTPKKTYNNIEKHLNIFFGKKKVFECQKNYNLNECTYQIYLIPFYFQKNVPFFSINSLLVGKFFLTKGSIISTSSVKLLLKKICYICKNCKTRYDQSVTSSKFKFLKKCFSHECKFIKDKKNLYFDMNSSLFEKIQKVIIIDTFLNNKNLPEVKNLCVKLTDHLTGICAAGDVIDIAGVLSFTHRKNTTENKLYMDAYFLDINFSKFSIEKKDILTIPNTHKIYEKISNILSFFVPGNKNFARSLLLCLCGTKLPHFFKRLDFSTNLNIFGLFKNSIVISQAYKLISSLMFQHDNITVILDTFYMIVPINLKNESNIQKDLTFNSSNEIRYTTNNIENVKKNYFNFILKSINFHLFSDFKKESKKINKRVAFIVLFCKENFKVKDIQKKQFYKLLFSFDLFFYPGKLNLNFGIKHAKYILNRYNLKHFYTIQKKKNKLKFIKSFVSEARKNFPVFSVQASEYLIYWYKCKKTKIREKSQVTVNKLCSIIKISKALASIRFQDRIYTFDIKEAFRLLKIKDVILNNRLVITTYITKRMNKNKIYRFMLFLAKKSNKYDLDICEVEKEILSQGYTKNELVKCIELYEQLKKLK